MRIFIGSDHAGHELKEKLQVYLKEKGHSVLDLGTFKAEPPTDYPDIAHEVAEKVRETPDSRGLLVCGTGIGMCMAANKIMGIRAANCESPATVEMSRKHNDANVLCLGGRVLETATALKMVDIFLETPFSIEERHIKRVQKIERK